MAQQRLCMQLAAMSLCLLVLVSPAAALKKAKSAFKKPTAGIMVQSTVSVQKQMYKCAIKEFDHATEVANEAIVQSTIASMGRRRLLQSPLSPTVVPVYFWVMYQTSQTYDNGYVPMTQILAQMQVMNTAYAGLGITFRIKKVTYQKNAKWVSCGQGTANEAAMKLHLRGKTNNGKPNAATNALNVYICDPQGPLGYAYYPSGSITSSDGVVMLWTTLPGGSYDYSNLGYTLVHETGHWLGLKHTFNGDPQGCNQGDLVSDTAYEGTANGGCPIGRDTCVDNSTNPQPTDPWYGVDPIWNFMDYSSDACMTNFTSLQFQRMAAQYAAFRQPGAGSGRKLR